MAQGNNAKREGARSHELYVLQALNRIKDAITGAFPSPSGLVLTSTSTTGAGTIPASSKAATIVIDGSGGSINGVVRPDGWSQTFEFHNDTLPDIDYNGNTTATMYIDILT